MADPATTSIILSSVATFGGLFAGRDTGPSGFAQVFGPGGLLEQIQRPVPPPEPEIPLAVPEPQAFVQVQGDVTGIGTTVPEELRGIFIERVFGPRSVRTPETSGAGGSGRGGRGGGGVGGRGGGATPPGPATRRGQREAIRREMEAIGRPTPNVPAVIRGREIGPPRPKIPEGVKISVKEKAALAVGIIGGAIIGSGGIIRVGPPRPGQPPPGEVGPFPPGVDPGDIGPFPPIPEEQRGELQEIEVSARRRAPVRTSTGVSGRPVPPTAGGAPVTFPTPPPSIPRSVLLGVLSASAFAGASAGAGQTSTTQVARPTAVPTPRPPPAPTPLVGSSLVPPSRPSGPRTRTCDKPARKNRKTCWEGFYREFSNRTDFVKWTKVDCKTRKIKEER